MKSLDLTPQQEAQWGELQSLLLYTCPHFTSVLYNLMLPKGNKYSAVFVETLPGGSPLPLAATDGRHVLLNPTTYFKLTPHQQLFVMCHEIAHCIFGHIDHSYHFARTGKVAYEDGHVLPFVPMLMNVAQDHIINDMLVQSKTGDMPKFGLHDTNIAEANDSMLDVYRKLFKQKRGGEKGEEGEKGEKGEKGDSPGHGGFDVHLEPGESGDQDAQSSAADRNEDVWRVAVASAMASAKAQGKLPSIMERVFGELLEPKVSWQDKIEGLFNRRLGYGGYNWKRPDRREIVRDIYAPSRSGFGAGHIVVAIDTSGSIGATELDTFMAELAGILDDVRPQRVSVAWCDAKLHRVDVVDEVGDLRELRAKGAPGGGGTSFVPVFKWIDETVGDVDALVYLTDGMGSFPKHEPNYPVIWGSIHKDSKYPFGDVVDIPLGK